MVTRIRENCRERCEAFSILAQEFNEEFALVTVMVGRQHVNVMMTRQSFVLVKDERVMLGNVRAYGLWPRASPYPTGQGSGNGRAYGLWPRVSPYPAGQGSGSCLLYTSDAADE